MKNWLIIGAAALQVLVLGYIAVERELVVLRGKTVYLRTAPIDPRDVFRGDYVRLDYEISHVPAPLLRDGLKNRKTDYSYLHPKDRPTVYAVLRTDGDIGELEYLTDIKPAGGLFLRGTIENDWSGASHVKYGIEAFFVQQKTGLDLERGQNEGGIQTPLEMKTAVGNNGTAVLKGYRWSKLGIGLVTETESPTNRLIRSVTIQLKNTSQADLAIVDLPGGRSLSLEADRIRDYSDADWKWVGATNARPAVSEESVKILKPGEIHTIRVDLTDPDWFVVKAGEKPKPINQLSGWRPMFRLVYRPPSPEECRHLPRADIIWHGHLMSRAFNSGRVD